MSSPVAKAARRITHEIHGVVVSAGLMQKTVKVRVGGQKWNKTVKKVCSSFNQPLGSLTSISFLISRPQFFANPIHHLVHDPNSSLRTGDVVSIVPGWPTSQHKRHVVKRIIAPHGIPINERPPVPTLEERIAEREAKKAAKDQRRAVRRAEDEKKPSGVTRKGTEYARGKAPATKISSGEAV